MSNCGYCTKEITEPSAVKGADEHLYCSYACCNLATFLNDTNPEPPDVPELQTALDNTKAELDNLRAENAALQKRLRSIQRGSETRKQRLQEWFDYIDELRKDGRLLTEIYSALYRLMHDIGDNTRENEWTRLDKWAVQKIRDQHAENAALEARIAELEAAAEAARQSLSNYTHGGAQYMPDILEADSILAAALEENPTT